MGRLEGTGRRAVLRLSVPNDEQGDKKELKEVVIESPALDAVLTQSRNRMQTRSEKEGPRKLGRQQRERGGFSAAAGAAASLCVCQADQKATASKPYPMRSLCVCVCRG